MYSKLEHQAFPSTEHSYKRLHPLNILYDFLFVNSWNVILLLVVLVNKFQNNFLYILKVAVFIWLVTSFAISIWRYVTFRYAVVDGIIYVKSSIRTVHLSKVQKVERNTSLVHKLFGVTSITLKTKEGSIHSSFTIAILPNNEADAIEETIKIIKIQKLSRLLKKHAIELQ